MLIGLSLVGCWFNGVRILAAREVRKLCVKRSEFIYRYNECCAFSAKEPIGRKSLDLGSTPATQNIVKDSNNLSIQEMEMMAAVPSSTVFDDSLAAPQEKEPLEHEDEPIVDEFVPKKVADNVTRHENQIATSEDNPQTKDEPPEKTKNTMWNSCVSWCCS